MSFHTDSLETLYDEIQALEDAILEASKQQQQFGVDEANAIADYEGKKSGYVLRLHAEESSAGFKGKRTDAIRQSMYRKKFENERLKRALAVNALSANQNFIKSLLAVLSAKQSRIRILESERKLAEYGK